MAPTESAENSDASRQLVISSDLGEQWMAVLASERGPVEELAIEMPRESPGLGSIYCAEVTRVIPGVSGAFVRIQPRLDAFLAIPESSLPDEEREQRNKQLEVGDPVIVQVTREADNEKGPRVTADITLPGWCLVLAPGSKGFGVSRRIGGERERERLNSALREIQVEGFGLIARTAAAGASKERLQSDRDRLMKFWRELQQQAERRGPPCLLHQEDARGLNYVRDHLACGIRTITVDDEKTLRELEVLLADAGTNVELQLDQNVPLIDRFRLDRSLEEIFHRIVSLPHGGRLIIEETEALVSIDVNSGRMTDADDLSQTALSTNLEAAEEIARQIRLRNLGGLIIIDFIDMRDHADRRKVDEALDLHLSGDRARIRTQPITEFCVGQVTRQRRERPVSHRLGARCSECSRTWAMGSAARARQLLRKIRRSAARSPQATYELAGPQEVVEHARALVHGHDGRCGVPSSKAIRFTVDSSEPRVVVHPSL